MSEVAETIYPVGRIYKMTGGGLTYIGSTMQALAKRFIDHKYGYERYLKGTGKYVTSSYKLFESGEDVLIELLEEHIDITKKKLHERERLQIEAHDCVNISIPNKNPTGLSGGYYEAQRLHTITCDCGAIVSKTYNKNHENSHKHLMRIMKAMIS